MENETTEIVCILDRSGSMSRVRDEAISGMNSFLQDQAAVPGQAALTLVRFDTEYEIVHSGIPIDEVPMLDHNTFQPRGMTALNDAIGRTIDDVGRRLSRTPEADRPAHVIVAILTDGHENASSDYTSERIQKMIEHQKSTYDWDFIYLGANQNAFAESGKFGVDREDTRQWESTPSGTLCMLREVSSMVSERRGAPRTTRKRRNRRQSASQSK